MRSIFLVFLAFISITSFAQQTKEEKKQAQYQEILKLVDSGKFEFIARRAHPPKVRAIDMTSNPNFLRIKDGAGHGDIPYFGRSFSGGYSSSDGGIKFDGPFESYDLTKNDKKRRVVIKFKVKGEGDTYTCTLNISSLQSTSLSVLSNKKQSINYTGYLQEIKKE